MKALVAAAALLAVSACTPRPKAKPGDYFPLAVGYDWIYRVSQPGADPRLLQFHIVSEATGDRGETRFLLDDTGSRYYLRHGDVVGYSISPDIWTIFLAGPLSQGKRFDGAMAVVVDYSEPPEDGATPTPPKGPPPMRIVKSSGYKTVTELHKKVTVPAGTFVDCVEVTHFAGPTTGKKYFAPGVGMVFAEAWFVDAETQERSLVSTQELVAYHLGDLSGGSLDRLAPVSPAPATTDSSTP